MNTDSIRKRVKWNKRISHQEILLLCEEVERLQRKEGIMQFLQIQLLQLVQQCGKKQSQKLRRAA